MKFDSEFKTGRIGLMFKLPTEENLTVEKLKTHLDAGVRAINRYVNKKYEDYCSTKDIDVIGNDLDETSVLPSEVSIRFDTKEDGTPCLKLSVCDKD